MKPFDDKLEDTLSTAKRVGNRHRPDVASILSAKGVTFHLLNLPNDDDKDDVVLFGREKEITALQRAVEKACYAEENTTNEDEACSKFQLVMISGEPGSGKTALAQTLHNQLRTKQSKQTQHHYFCIGKFDQTYRTLPYVGIQAAMSNLAHQILNHGQERSRVRDGLRAMLGKEDATIRQARLATIVVMTAPSRPVLKKF